MSLAAGIERATDAAGRGTALAAIRPSARRLALAYVELMKPRIVALVIFTGLPALLMARRGIPEPRTLWGALIGTALAAASAASFNHYLDRDIDGLMKRTAQRPLPAGLLQPWHALGLAVLLGALSWVVLVTCANRLAAAIAMLSIFYYAVVYTAWLKRRTPENIVIGGGAGAVAPLIAWASPRSCSPRSCSSGPRPTSGRSLSIGGTTTRGPASRCCP
jgi:protoheme IX farnesyltransferase